jgi:hypothetical protein
LFVVLRFTGKARGGLATGDCLLDRAPWLAVLFCNQRTKNGGRPGGPPPAIRSCRPSSVHLVLDQTEAFLLSTAPSIILLGPE